MGRPHAIDYTNGLKTAISIPDDLFASPDMWVAGVKTLEFLTAQDRLVKGSTRIGQMQEAVVDQLDGSLD